MKKISIFGDIMCEPSVLKAARKKDGSYEFSGIFEYLLPMISESDYCIGNLEFPLAGKDAKYTDTFVEFNAPDEFAVAVKNAGFDLISTINNHTLDRGFDGMVRTLKVLDEIGLDHTGNYLPEKGREEAFYFELDGVKFAVICYTYNTNTKLDENDPNMQYLNLLHAMKMPNYMPEIYEKMNSWVEKTFKGIKEEHQATIRKLVGLPAVVIRADDFMDMPLVDPYIEKFVADIKKAKQKADYVICYPHVGGQFNDVPGEFTEHVMENATKAGADIVIASHSHLVQGTKDINGVFCAYSIGNVSMSPNSSIVVKECLPDYGIVMHLYFDGKTLAKKTFSIIKGVEKKGKLLKSYPIDLLYSLTKKEKDKKKLLEHVKKVYLTFTGKELKGEVIQKEYEL